MTMLVGMNAELCSGCYACSVACMDQNALLIEGGQPPWRKVIKIEKGNYPQAKITFVSVSCLNCNDPKCVEVCPVGALFMDNDSKTVNVASSLCTGCRLCASACPFKVIRFGEEGTVEKCNGCKMRAEKGFLPACVRTCPTGALIRDRKLPASR